MRSEHSSSHGSGTCVTFAALSVCSRKQKYDRFEATSGGNVSYSFVVGSSSVVVKDGSLVVVVANVYSDVDDESLLVGTDIELVGALVAVVELVNVGGVVVVRVVRDVVVRVVVVVVVGGRYSIDTLTSLVNAVCRLSITHSDMCDFRIEIKIELNRLRRAQFSTYCVAGEADVQQRRQTRRAVAGTRKPRMIFVFDRMIKSIRHALRSHDR